MSLFRRAGAELLKIVSSVATDPVAVASRIFVYGKDVAGVTQLFARASDGTISQITPMSQGAVTVTNAMSPYTVLATDNWIFVDTTAGTINLQLPNPATFGSIKSFRIVDATGNLSANNLFLVPFGAELIDGLNNNKRLLTAWGGWTLVTNLTNWFTF